MNVIRTTHNLDFEACPWPRNPAIQLFRIGTVEGQWIATDVSYCIISFINNKPGNGHLDDVFEWFEYSCRRDGRALMLMEFMNERFKKHCIEKRGFEPIHNTHDLIKFFQ